MTQDIFENIPVSDIEISPEQIDTLKKRHALNLCKTYNEHHGKDFVVRKTNRNFGTSTFPYVVTYRIDSMFDNDPIITS